MTFTSVTKTVWEEKIIKLLKDIIIENQIEKEKIQKRLSALPNGKLLCQRNGKYYKWYVSDGKKRTYIPKNNKSFASQLAYKQYLQIRLQQLETENKKIQKIFQKTNSTNLKMTNLMSNHGMQELLNPYISLNKTDKDWMNEKYPKNPFHPEQLTVESVNGLMVRSKSESHIAIALNIANIPFRYECELVLGKSEYVYPDFTIKLPGRGDIVYWEHLGMMDIPSYFDKNHRKLEKYIRNGIIPGKNMILTYETSDRPLSYEFITQTVQFYLM